MTYTDYFYYFGFIYIAHRLYTVINAALLKNAEQKTMEEVIEESTALGIDVVSGSGGTTKSYLRANGVDLLFVTLNTIWVFSGMWTHEQLFFLLLFVLTFMLLYFRLVRQQHSMEIWYITYFLKIIIATLILFKHWQVI